MSQDAAQAHFETLFGPEFGDGKSFDLANLRAALAALGAPHANLPPVIHIAGTNGKGSTLAFLRAMFESAGLRAHAFAKPHLLQLNERFRIAGRLAQTPALIAAADRVHASAPALSQFDAQVAAAFLLFAETPADYVLLETGMGGRDDSTNVIAAPALAILTPIDFDHQAALGESIAAIAAHKAGIIKHGAPVICARQPQDARRVIEEAARRNGAPLLLCGRDWDAYARADRLIVETENRLLDLPPPALFGAHQIDNAGLAIAAALTLENPRITEDSIAAGLAAARHPARMERVRGADRELWIDGAHNPAGARALVVALAQLSARARRETRLIVGMLARKDAAGFLAELAPIKPRLVTTPIAGAECISAEALASEARRLGLEAEAARDLSEALDLAPREARIVICGSLALAAEAFSRFGLTVD